MQFLKQKDLFYVDAIVANIEYFQITDAITKKYHAILILLSLSQNLMILRNVFK
jgi:hypothetical protein